MRCMLFIYCFPFHLFIGHFAFLYLDVQNQVRSSGLFGSAYWRAISQVRLFLWVYPSPCDPSAVPRVGGLVSCMDGGCALTAREKNESARGAADGKTKGGKNTKMNTTCARYASETSRIREPNHVPSSPAGAPGASIGTPTASSSGARLAGRSAERLLGPFLLRGGTTARPGYSHRNQRGFSAPPIVWDGRQHRERGRTRPVGGDFGVGRIHMVDAAIERTAPRDGCRTSR